MSKLDCQKTEMMNDLKTHTVCVYDSGLMTSVAERIARDVGKTIFFSPWMTAFPDPDLADIGSGLAGIQRADFFWDYKDETDTFVFPGVGFGDIQMELVRQGKAVWGSRKAEEMELYRWGAADMMERAGLAQPERKLVIGVDNLRAFIKKNPGWFIKVSKFRGIGETFEAENYALVEARLDFIAAEIGPFRKRTQEFTCWKAIPTKIETGGDHYLVNGESPKRREMFGIEIKDLGYLITAVKPSELPESVQELNRKLGPMLKAYNYSGPFHSEIRIGEDGKNYPIDLTCRTGSPPSETMEEWLTNYTQIIIEGARGNLIEFETEKKYGFQIALESPLAPDMNIAVQYPAEIARWIKLYNHMKDENGLSWVAATDAKLQQIGSAVGLGDTIEEAVTLGLEHARQVKADKLDVKTGMVSKLVEELKAAADKGITLGNSPIPDKIDV
jgi:hypothetical protein